MRREALFCGAQATRFGNLKVAGASEFLRLVVLRIAGQLATN